MGKCSRRIHHMALRPGGAYAVPAMSDAATLIETHSLGKSYGKVQALRELSIAIPPGAVGLLGPNGAGKTTLMKLLLGLLVPTEGRASIVGEDPRTRRGRLSIRERVGYMPEGDCLLPNATGVELVSMLGRLTGMRAADAMTRTHEVLDYCQLEEARYRPVTGFSTGMKQRLKLAQALVHDPQVLLLDEPTNGLDPKGRRQMLELVADLAQNHGKNVLLCTHLLPDVERTCESVIALQDGSVKLVAEVAELTRAEGARYRLLVIRNMDAFCDALDPAGVVLEKREGRRCTLRLPDESQSADLLFHLAHQSGAVLESVEPARSSLEEAFLTALQPETQPVQA
ncbi:MAG TPA: ABC transporter ATP-binding protein [Planctomycetes bacterium]|nr:ABC transporter ATP-binding protein [Planctomycetota bacterium]HIL50998.1 ABC transporter ATP-binding protein [Planctomycetota bacterium]